MERDEGRKMEEEEGGRMSDVGQKVERKKEEGWGRRERQREGGQGKIEEEGGVKKTEGGEGKRKEEEGWVRMEKEE